MAIVNGQINLADTTLLTVPAGKRYAITTIMVCNTQPEDTGGGNDTMFDLHLVPSGQTKGYADPNANQILNNLPKKDIISIYLYDFKFVLSFVLLILLFLIS